MNVIDMKEFKFFQKEPSLLLTLPQTETPTITILVVSPTVRRFVEFTESMLRLNNNFFSVGTPSRTRFSIGDNTYICVTRYMDIISYRWDTYRELEGSEQLVDYHSIIESLHWLSENNNSNFF